MNVTVDLFFQIHSYWHVGTGHGDGAAADAVALRDAVSGLPYVPGRQIKGLLRDAVFSAEELGLYEKTGVATALFGTPITITTAVDGAPERAMAAARYRTEEATLRVESAVLGKNEEESRHWSAWALENRAKVATLFRPFASTKLKDDGTAEDHTLRSIELVVPMRLRGQVSGPSGDWPKLLAKALPFIDGVGGHRTRGLGRVTVEMGAVR